MLSFNLTPIFKARGITKPYTFLVKAGISPSVATNIINGKPSVLRLDHVELLCRVLVCEPNDLLLWTPDSKHVYAANHPLHNLKKENINGSLHDTIATMPLKQLQQVTKSIIGNVTEQNL